jgi:hypothetical protein
VGEAVEYDNIRGGRKAKWSGGGLIEKDVMAHHLLEHDTAVRMLPPRRSEPSPVGTLIASPPASKVALIGEAPCVRAARRPAGEHPLHKEGEVGDRGA